MQWQIIKCKNSLLAISVVMLVSALISGVIYFQKTAALKDNLDIEMLKSERLLSESLMFQQKNEGFYKRVHFLTDENEELRGSISAKETLLGKYMNELMILRKGRSDSKKFKNQLDQLTKINLDLEANYRYSNESLELANFRNKELTLELTELREQNEKYADDLGKFKSGSTDNHFIETRTKRGKQD